MERTSTNVKDKWKEIGGNNWELRKKDFDLKSTLKMIKYIDESLSVQKYFKKQDSAGGKNMTFYCFYHKKQQSNLIILLKTQFNFN